MDSSIGPKRRNPVREAYKLLSMIYESMKNSGHTPHFEEFYPIDLNALARLLGWEVERVQDAGYVGTVRTDAHIDFDKKKITLSSRDITQGRLNFTFAHEIGHIVLHGKEGKQTLLRAPSIREKRISLLQYPIQYDVEADRFAKELLMPSRAVRRRFQKLFGCTEIVANSSIASAIINAVSGKNHLYQRVDSSELARNIAEYVPDPQLGSLSDFFGVSVQAMAYRLLELRLLLE